jgi:hypothetical protein
MKPPNPSTHDKVLAINLHRGDPAWEALVPPRIVQIITQDKLFGYQPPQKP